VQSAAPGDRVQAFGVQPPVDQVGGGLARMLLGPAADELVVVRAAAQGARTVAGRQRGRLVQEEQLGESAGLHQRCAMPAAEAQPAGDPPAARVRPADPALGIV